MIKAEETGKIVVLTDIIFNGESATAVECFIRQGGAAGTIIGHLTNRGNYKEEMSFREGLEGAAYDGSNGGDLYVTFTGGTRTFTVTGYMRDA